jgi:hypothetical protein
MIGLDVLVTCNAVNSSIVWVDATEIICVGDGDFRLDACAGFANSSMEARNTGQASKIILAMFIIHK